jgi:hypothetical protein
LIVLQVQICVVCFMDISISCNGPVILQCMIVSSLTRIVAHIYNRALVVALTVHVS